MRLTGYVALQAVAELKQEQLSVGKKNVESDMLRRESMTLDMEGRKLREDWDDKVATNSPLTIPTCLRKYLLSRKCKNLGMVIKSLHYTL